MSDSARNRIKSMALARASTWVLAALLLGCSVQYTPERSASKTNHTAQAKAVPAFQEADARTIQPLTITAGELWIIEKPRQTPDAAATVKWTPPTLTLQARGTARPCPLSRVDVQARVTGCIAAVEVSQQFENPASEPAEATYSFPLPAGATLTDLAITIGTRHIRAIVREREEAQQIYRQASRQGYLVSLISETEPNVFVQSIGNIPPRQAVEIQTEYLHCVGYEDGWFAFGCPLTSVLQNDHLTLSVALNPGFALERIESPTHRMGINLMDEAHAIATLEPGQSNSQRELVLRFRPAIKGVAASLFTSRDQTGEGGFVALTLVPPADIIALPRRPIEVIIVSNVVDPEAKDKAAPVIRRVLEKLHEDDRFMVLGGWPQPVLPEGPVAASAENRARAMEALAQPPQVQTDVIARLQAALATTPMFRTRIIFLVTDGKADLRPILEHLGDVPTIPRIVVLAVEEGPHISKAAALAYRSGGALARLEPPNRLEPAIDDLMDSISHPASIVRRLVWKGAHVTDVVPQAQDLLVGHPLLITGRFKGQPPTEAMVEDQGGGGIYAAAITIPADRSSPSLAAVWARMKMTEAALEPPGTDTAAVQQRIRRLAMEFGLVSPYTAYICVDAKTRTASVP